VFSAKVTGTRSVVVEPTVVVEVSADAAIHAGRRFCHPLRYLRVRPE